LEADRRKVIDYNYASPRRRRFAIRLIVMSAIVAGMILAAYTWQDTTVVSRIQLLIAQHECANGGSDSNNEVAFVMAPRGVSIPEKSDGHFRLVKPSYNWGPVPPELQRLIEVADEQSEYYVRIVAPSARPIMRLLNISNKDVVLFSGYLSSPGGHERLVILTRTITGLKSEALNNNVDAYTITPATILKGPSIYHETMMPKHAHFLGIGDYHQTLRFYLGQHDSRDPAHFLVRYELDNQRGTLEGRLGDDDRLYFGFRDGLAFDASDSKVGY
jgi:hypothetical protein